MLVTSETVAGFLDRAGWHHEDHGEGLQVAGFRGRSGAFRVFLQLADPWLMMAVIPFVPQPAPACRDRFYRYVLGLNFSMNLCKIGADADGDISLSLEVRAHDLRYEDFSAALQTISYYTDTLYEPLLNLARDPNFEPPEMDESSA